MSWTSAFSRLPGKEDGSKQLVAYLENFFGDLSVKYTLGYYSLDKNGWLDWYTEQSIPVSYWMCIEGLTLQEMVDKTGLSHELVCNVLDIHGGIEYDWKFNGTLLG